MNLITTCRLENFLDIELAKVNDYVYVYLLCASERSNYTVWRNSRINYLSLILLYNIGNEWILLRKFVLPYFDRIKVKRTVLSVTVTK